MNPRGFRYCGFCASPLENTEMRAKIAELAAPPGGWPSLAAELLEVKFFLQQGQLDDADELLAILQQRYPGHPELSEFTRSAIAQADDEVVELVHEVLARSPDLASKIPRRAAPKWEAPAAAGRGRTTSHTPVDPDVPPELVPTAKLSPAKVERERTKVYQSVDPRPAPSQSGMTMAVETLQPPAPFRDDKERSPSKRRLKRAAKTSRKCKVVGSKQQPSDGTPRRRKGSAFGQHILTRYGRKSQR